jgi:hypothetical protein
MKNHGVKFFSLIVLLASGMIVGMQDSPDIYLINKSGEGVYVTINQGNEGKIKEAVKNNQIMFLGKLNTISKLEIFPMNYDSPVHLIGYSDVLGISDNLYENFKNAGVKATGRAPRTRINFILEKSGLKYVIDSVEIMDSQNVNKPAVTVPLR